MADSTSTPEGFSLKRWSRRKLEAAQNAPVAPVPSVGVAPAAAPVAAPAAAVATAPGASAPAAAPVLPPVESLTHDSDFSAFMQPRVDEVVKRAALKKLFTDPHFNVMDGLDIYIGDYTQADPMPDGMLEKLGKVYAAVTHPEDAAAQLAPSADLPATAPASAGPAPADTAAAEHAGVDAADAEPALPPTPDATISVPAALQEPTYGTIPVAPPSGKPL
jgi:hypothetical protein